MHGSVIPVFLYIVDTMNILKMQNQIHPFTSYHLLNGQMSFIMCMYK
jgi:hypothetical protein